MNVHTNWFVCIEQIVGTTSAHCLMLLVTFDSIYSITYFKVACFTLDKIVCTQRNFLTANCHKFQVRAVNYSHIVIIIGKLCKTVFRFFCFVVIWIKRVLLTEYYAFKVFIHHIGTIVNFNWIKEHLICRIAKFKKDLLN